MSTPDPLGQIEYHLSQAMHLLHQYRGASGSPLPAELAGALSRKSKGSNNKSLREWVAWLKKNQPAYRQEIWDATGLNLTASKSSVLDWTSDMAYWDDSQMPPDALCRMRGPASGPGAPPSIYFLWSQRFEIHDKYGVGPSERPEPETLLGVVHPPTAQPFHGIPEIQYEPLTGEPTPQPDPEPEVETSQFATLDEWHEKWDSLFDTLVKYGSVPTDEEKEEMLSTMPEDTGGEPKGTVLARALHEARQRANGGEF